MTENTELLLLEAFGRLLYELQQKASYMGPVTAKNIKIDMSFISAEYVVDADPGTVHETTQHWF